MNEVKQIPCYMCREYYSVVPYCLLKYIIKDCIHLKETKGLCREMSNYPKYCYYNPFDSKIDLMIAIMKSKLPETF